MAIQLHCEHCGKLIQAPDSSGGRPGKCPYCEGTNYIPLSEDEVGELPLTPLDEAFEQHRKKAAAEDLAVQRRLWQERDRSRNTGRGGGVRRPDPPVRQPSVTAMSEKQVTSLVVSFIDAMSKGNLEKAEALRAQLSNHKTAAVKILDEMVTEDLNGYGLPSLPRPVLTGFMKQLRSRL